MVIQLVRKHWRFKLFYDFSFLLQNLLKGLGVCAHSRYIFSNSKGKCLAKFLEIAKGKGLTKG